MNFREDFRRKNSSAVGRAQARGGKAKGAKNKRTIAKVPLRAATAHRKTTKELPLDILMAVARNKSLPLDLRLAAAAKAAPYYHAKVSGGPPKASFEMTKSELEAAIAREKEHALRAAPGPQIRVIGNR